jgi:ATP-binding cassette subfamily B protein
VAHRLSTIRKAHQIVVMHSGMIIETGSHESLMEKKGKYFELVQSQLDTADTVSITTSNNTH